MCFVRNVQTSRTKHIGLESPMGPCLRHVMFAHIMRVEVVRCERRSTTCRREPADQRTLRAWQADGGDYRRIKACVR